MEYDGITDSRWWHFSGKELHTLRCVIICGSAISAPELRKVQVDFTPVLRAVREGKQAGCHL